MDMWVGEYEGILTNRPYFGGTVPTFALKFAVPLLLTFVPLF